MFRKLMCFVCFVFVLGLALPGASNAADPDLVGWWRLDETSGTVAYDSSGNGNDGTVRGNPQWTTGKIAGALAFDNSVPSAVEINTAGMSASAGTVALWVYLSPDQSATGPRYLFGHIVTQTWDNRLELYMEGSNTNLDIGLGSHGSSTDVVTLAIETWYHISLTWDQGSYVVYLDGQVRDKGSYTGFDTLNPKAEIGNNGSDRSQGFNGLLDDVRIYNRALTHEEIIAVWRGDFALSSEPNPEDGATDVLRDVVLGWTPGQLAQTHNVYLGTVFDVVNDADVTNPLDVLVSENQDALTYAFPGLLEFGQTYYWRVDEVNAPPDSTVFKGHVWSFTVESTGYPIPGERITATASSSDVAKGPENTVNGSGLDDSGLLHGIVGVDSMWLSSLAGDQPTWIEYEFDKIYKLHQMWVWNSNESLEPVIGLGFKDVFIEYSLNGTDYTTLGTTAEFAKAPGAPDYAHDTTVDLSGVAANYVRLTANSNWGGILNQYGLSEVRFFHIPVHAREPNPDSGAADVDVDVTLGFRAGREAAKHDVYFSDSRQAVVDGTADVTTVTETSYGPLSLDLSKTYYWRVDEVNEAETPATWQGDLWDFTTQEYFVVDDFESYNDLDTDDPNSNRIFNTWIDGYEQPTNGSIVGYDVAPFAEQNIVHGGKQSMPLAYDNSGTANYSEATLTLSSRRDWTVRGIEALSLWFRGNRVALVEEPAGTFTVNASGADIWGTSDEFRYVWKQLSGDGEIIAQVLSVENTHEWAKAGVMIRDTLDAGSPNVFVAITGGGGDGATFQWRPAPGGTSSSSRTLVGISPPASVKLVRKGSLFTGYVFLDGQWQQEGQLVAVSMTDPVYIGLAVTSHAAGVACKAVFSDIQTTGAVSGQFTEQAIGVDMPSNSPAPMYVALANSGGTPAVVFHDDPSATQISNWMEWLIDLKQFSDGGVNLTNVNTISIGFGDKNNPQPGGSGIMYFDDIRLYPSAMEP